MHVQWQQQAWLNRQMRRKNMHSVPIKMQPTLRVARVVTAPSEQYPATWGDECRRCWNHLRRGGSLGRIPLLEEPSFNLSTDWPCVNQQGERKQGAVTLSFSVWELIEGMYWLNPINEGTTSTPAQLRQQDCRKSSLICSFCLRIPSWTSHTTQPALALGHVQVAESILWRITIKGR